MDDSRGLFPPKTSGQFWSIGTIVGVEPLLIFVLIECGAAFVITVCGVGNPTWFLFVLASAVAVTVVVTMFGTVVIEGFSDTTKAVRAYHMNTRAEVRGTRTKEVHRHHLNTISAPGIPNRSSHLYIPSHLFLHKNQYLKLLKFYCASLNKKTLYMP